MPTSRCPRCQQANRPGARFCDACGTPLAPATPPAPWPAQPASKPEAGRRQLTVMFCDLVGSTPLAAQLDPEELREVLRAYQDACARVIRRFEGHIAKYLGDGLLVYFGYPRAHEDDARRAARAGLGMVEAIQHLSARLQQEQGVTLTARLGIHTGLVVLAEMGAEGQRELDIVGETPHIAARLQEQARPNEIVVSDLTHRLIAGYFHCQALGERVLKGMARPLSLYRVVHESAARSRLEAAATHGRLTPLVGREQERLLLQQRWRQARAGSGQVVVVSGEAGIGKSRLAQAIKEEVAADPEAWLVEWHCSPYHGNTALHPVMEYYQRVVLQFQREDTAEDRWNRIEGLLAQYDLPLEEAAPLLADLLEVPLGERHAPLDWPAAERRRRTLELVVRILQGRASRQPVLLVMEDLQWSDPSTLELLDQVVERIPTTAVLAVLTHRQAFQPPWSAHPHLTSLALGRLSEEQVGALVVEVTGGRALPDALLRQVVSQTDGVPLYVEELIKSVLESELLREEEGRYRLAGSVGRLAIPATLQESLAARLDRLSEGRQAAQWGAAIGREFDEELLRRIMPMREETLGRALQQLVDAEVIWQRGQPPQSVYRFRHALVQEAAYQSTLKSTRRQIHGRIAKALEESFPETAELEPEIVARHYTEAGRAEKAIEHWRRAATRAAARSALAEAAGHLQTALGLLDGLPQTPDRSRLELELQLALIGVLTPAKGYASPELEPFLERAGELSTQVEDRALRFAALAALWGFCLFRLELARVEELAGEMLAVARGAGDAALLMRAHASIGVSMPYRGRLRLAREHLERAVALHDHGERHALALAMPYDPGMVALAYLGWTLTHLGYPDQALDRARQAVALAEARHHPVSLALSLWFLSVVHSQRREWGAGRECAEQAMALAGRQRAFFLAAAARVFHAWALAGEGRVAEGLDQLRQARADWRATGARLGQPTLLLALAEACARARQPEEGLAAAAEGLTLVERTGERLYEAELHRVRGELLAQGMEHGDQGPQGDRPRRAAAACFQQALAVAREQEARAFELRAAMGLARLRQTRGRRERALRMLAGVYQRFTEGFDTADLQEARQLLEEREPEA